MSVAVNELMKNPKIQQWLADYAANFIGHGFEEYDMHWKLDYDFENLTRLLTDKERGELRDRVIQELRAIAEQLCPNIQERTLWRVMRTMDQRFERELQSLKWKVEELETRLDQLP